MKKGQIAYLLTKQNFYSVDTPMEVNFKLDETCKIDQSYERKCRSLVGSLMYATVGTRPDLTMSVYYLSRFQSKPSETLWKSLKRILRYIKGTLNYTLLYTKDYDSLPLIGYADANWARDSDRKSTSGYLFKVYNNSVVWRSKKQTMVALSTTDAEFVSLCEATVEACWIKKLLLDLGIKINTITIFEDNQSTIRSVKNHEQKKLKHMDIKFQFVKHKVEQGVINVEYICTRRQIADIFTKPLCKNLFRFFINEIGLSNKITDIEEEC